MRASRANRYVLTLSLFLFICTGTALGQGGRCLIRRQVADTSKWHDEARCLLRKVQMDRKLGPSLTNLPTPLDSLVGKTNVIDKVVLDRYLTENNIEPVRLGGPLETSITMARYFVIHDTSWPNYERADFPKNEVLNGNDWSRGRLERLKSGEKTHVWVDRVGESITSTDYARMTPKSAVKLEDRYPNLKGLFLHTELIQPRRCHPDRPVCCYRDRKGERHCSDPISPTPGFSDAQYDRLALLYVAASSRRGVWLVPAFHGVVDDEFGNGAHDDPQNFDLEVWATHLADLINKLSP